MADVALDHRKRQAAYAAKNRRKAKALRRPDARAVADAYMAAVEDGGLERMMRVYIGKLAPDADIDARSHDVIEIVRTLVSLVLFNKGFDSDQTKDKLASMTSTADLSATSQSPEDRSRFPQ